MAAGALVFPSPAASGDECTVATSLDGAEAVCVARPHTETPSGSSTPTVIYHDSPTNPFQDFGTVFGLLMQCEMFGGVDPQARPEVLFPGAGLEFSCEQAAESVAGQVRSAFVTLDWPASKLLVDPGEGETLVNLETEFWTTNTRPTVRRVTLLGQQVEVEATPVGYRFVFGEDGPPLPEESAEQSSPTAGPITHRYARPGRVSASVDTTYSGRFRIGAGPWREITATATVPGIPVPLMVREARPVLVR